VLPPGLRHALTEGRGQIHRVAVLETVDQVADKATISIDTHAATPGALAIPDTLATEVKDAVDGTAATGAPGFRQLP
jgi:hypothetical protein